MKIYLEKNLKILKIKIIFGANDKNDVTIVAIYTPNGTGKTSLAKVLGTKKKDKNIGFEVKFKKVTYTTENSNVFILLRAKVTGISLKVKIQILLLETILIKNKN